MPNLKYILIICLLGTSLGVSFGQENNNSEPGTEKKSKDKKQKYGMHHAFIMGAGWHFIDDDGSPFSLFNVNNGWNGVGYPTRFTIEKGLSKAFSLEAQFTATKYAAGNVKDKVVLTADEYYYSFDLNGRFHLNTLYNGPDVIDAYVLIGTGINSRANTANVGVGANLWLTNQFGLSIQSMGKFSLQETNANHIQHAAGVVFRLFSPTKKAFGKMKL